MLGFQLPNDSIIAGPAAVYPRLCWTSRVQKDCPDIIKMVNQKSMFRTQGIGMRPMMFCDVIINHAAATTTVNRANDSINTVFSADFFLVLLLVVLLVVLFVVLFVVLLVVVFKVITLGTVVLYS